MSPSSDPSPPLSSGIGQNDGEADGGRPTVLSLIRQIQARTLSPRNLSAADRRLCVEHLSSEGYSLVETAEVLQVSERTVARDRAAVLEANALQRDPGLAARVAGRLLKEAELCVSRMRRVARDKDCPHAVRVDAEHRCFQVLRDVTGTLQDLGYLPAAAREVRADVTHHAGDGAPPDYGQMRLEVLRLREVGQALGTADPAALERIDQLEQVIARAAVAAELQDLSQRLNGGATHEPRP